MLHFACLWMHPSGSVLRTPDCVCRLFVGIFLFIFFFLICRVCRFFVVVFFFGLLFFLVCCVCRYLFVHVYNCTSDWMFDSGFYLR